MIRVPPAALAVCFVSVIGAPMAMGCATAQRYGAVERARPATVRQVSATAPVPNNRGCPKFGDQMVKSAVRSSDAQVQSLLIEGCRLSPTLRRLADAIGRTDGVVYLTTGLCQLRTVRACLLHTIVDTGNARYLWIRFADNADRKERVVNIAQELQHAVEVLSHPNVRSKRALLDLYRFGESQADGRTTIAGPFRSYETTAAIDVSGAVRSELAAASGTAFRPAPQPMSSTRVDDHGRRCRCA